MNTDLVDLISYLAHHVQLMNAGTDVLKRYSPDCFPSAPHELDKIYGVALSIINCTTHFAIGEFNSNALQLINLVQASMLALYHCGFEAGQLLASMDTIVNEADDRETD